MKIHLAFGCLAVVVSGCGAGAPGPISGGDHEPVTCGGIAARPCPGGGRCVDDPSDSCDPRTGGADCGGVCSCIETVLCVQGAHFDSSPAVCACVANVGACAQVRCAAGTHCVERGASASCQPG